MKFLCEYNTVSTYPNSSKERLRCCSSDSRSPLTPDFLIRSLPARSQLLKKKKKDECENSNNNNKQENETKKKSTKNKSSTSSLVQYILNLENWVSGLVKKWDVSGLGRLLDSYDWVMRKRAAKPERPELISLYVVCHGIFKVFLSLILRWLASAS